MSEQKKPQPEVTGEEQNVSGEQTQGTTAEEYARAIKDLKANSVSREEYDRLRAEHSTLTKALAEGKSVDPVDEPKNEKTIEEIVKDVLGNKQMNNLDYVKQALSYREQMLEKGKADPFCPNSRVRPNTRDDIDKAEKVARILKECVDAANGSSELFNSELQRRMR